MERRDLATKRHTDIWSMLSAGPWCWPTPENKALRSDLARRLTDSGLPEYAGLSKELETDYVPQLHPGVALLLTANVTAATLWSLDFRPGQLSHPGSATPLDRIAMATLETACRALPRSSPVMLESLWDVQKRWHAARQIVTLHHGGKHVVPQLVLSDQSFGLSFALGLASWMLDCALPSDLAASATINEFGQTGEVEKIKHKIAVLTRFAPQVRRLLIADNDEHVKEARSEAANSGLRIIPVNSVKRALAEVFADGNLPGALPDQMDLPTLFVRQGDHDEQKRRRIVDSVFTLALGLRRSLVDWTPVRQTADLALERWEEQLSPADRDRLKVASAVADRHMENKGRLDGVSEALLSELLLEHQLEYVSHVVQQSADTGYPPPEEAEQVALRFLEPGTPLSGGHLKLKGALGRLYGVIGRADEGLSLQIEAARQWFKDPRNWEQLSFPLDAAFRLAGALENRVVFDEADLIMRRALEAGKLGEHGRHYAALGHAKACVAFGDQKTALNTLNTLFTNMELEPDLRLPPARWLVQIFDSRKAEDESNTILDALAPEKQPSEEHLRLAAGVRALIGLDRACRQASAGLVQARIDQLLEADPGPTTNLIRHAPEGTPLDQANFIRLFFPY